MMNPSAYREEEDRYESQSTANIRCEREQGPARERHRYYTREVLPCGCTLYRMTMRKNCDEQIGILRWSRT
jgi:hypothetical protein